MTPVPPRPSVASVVETVDWSKTPIGPADQWPLSLRTVLRLTLASRYAMWFGWGPQLTFFCNDTYRDQTLGEKFPWAIGQSARAVWAEIWDVLEPRVRHVMTTGEATYDEGLLLFLERNGYPEETYHSFSYSPAPGDAVGKIGGLFCVVVEETERVIGERRIAFLGHLAARLSRAKASNEVFAALHACLQEDARDVPFALLYLFDESSPSAHLASAAGFVGEHAAAPEHLRLDDERAPWPLASVRSGGAPVVVELDPARPWPKGPWKAAPARARLLPIASATGESGHPIGVLVAGLNPHRPFDDKAREFLTLLAGQLSAGLATAGAYEAERKRAEALAEIDRAKTTFFSNVSHEFRTPLTLMLGPMEDARALPERSLAGESLDTVYRNALRLLKLVNALLEFSRIEAGRLHATYVKTDLAALTGELASVFQSSIERAGLRLVVDTPPLDASVFVDRDMWEKIVLNLLSNALKFTFEGEIAVTLRLAGDHVVLSVRDTGTGIPASELPRIFERFHRVQGAVGRTHEGSGIGLALVSELVKLHGGDIRAESVEGRGTVFTVSVPVGCAHLDRARIADAVPTLGANEGTAAYVEEALRWLPSHAGVPSSSLGAAGLEPASGGATRIVLADDNADMRDYVARLLSTRWRVEAVPDGHAALAAARREPPALIVSDIMMPRLDGLGLLRELRNDPRLKSTPVILLSARAGGEATAEGLATGANDYLVKPFTARELVARVAAQIAMATLRDEIDHAKAAQRRMLEELFNNAPAGICILRGRDLVYEFANPRYVAVTQRTSAADFVGKTIFEALPELRGQGFDEQLLRVIDTGEAFLGNEIPVFLHRDGEPVTVFFNYVYVPITNDHGVRDGAAVFAYDVSSAVLARREVEEARQGERSARIEAEEASRAKDEFLAILGHELRNPLAPITTALQLMRLRGSESREQAVIERQVDHLKRLVDDLLDVSRVARGKVELRKRPVELSSLVARAIEVASPLMEQQRHVLDIAVARTGLLVDVDEDRMVQVISNLLTNAAKYSNERTRIEVHAHRDGDRVRLVVRDHGIGIAPEMLERIFELFVQQSQALDRARGGLGLGLTIVRSLVKLHGGTVTAHSEGLGKGSELVVELPASTTSAIVPAPGTLPLTAEKATAAGLRGRVLVVDDNRDAAEMLEEALKGLGYTVATANDGPAALDVARRFRPQVALLDIGLPVMDGYELARRLRSGRHLFGDVRLVSVTGYGTESDRERSDEAGFHKHLVKPVDIRALESVVMQLIGEPRAEG